MVGWRFWVVFLLALSWADASQTGASLDSALESSPNQAIVDVYVAMDEARVAVEDIKSPNFIPTLDKYSRVLDALCAHMFDEFIKGENPGLFLIQLPRLVDQLKLFTFSYQLDPYNLETLGRFQAIAKHASHNVAVIRAVLYVRTFFYHTLPGDRQPAFTFLTEEYRRAAADYVQTLVQTETIMRMQVICKNTSIYIEAVACDKAKIMKGMLESLASLYKLIDFEEFSKIHDQYYRVEKAMRLRIVQDHPEFVESCDLFGRMDVFAERIVSDRLGELFYRAMYICDKSLEVCKTLKGKELSALDGLTRATFDGAHNLVRNTRDSAMLIALKLSEHEPYKVTVKKWMSTTKQYEARHNKSALLWDTPTLNSRIEGNSIECVEAPTQAPPITTAPPKASLRKTAKSKRSKASQSKAKQPQSPPKSTVERVEPQAQASRERAAPLPKLEAVVYFEGPEALGANFGQWVPVTNKSATGKNSAANKRKRLGKKSVASLNADEAHFMFKDQPLNCMAPLGEPQDDRRDKGRLKVTIFNPEWLFLFGGSATHPCPGPKCRWSSIYSSWSHIKQVASTLSKLDSDMVVLPEVEDCRVLQILIELIGPEKKYRPYLHRWKDSLGQNVGLLTRVDPTGDIAAISSIPAIKEVRARVSYPPPKGFIGTFQLDVGNSGIKSSMVLTGTHFISRGVEKAGDSEAARRFQASLLSNYLAEAYPDPSYAHVIAGDFNAADPALATADCSDVEGEGSLNAIREMRTDISNAFEGHISPDSYTHDSFSGGKRVIDHIFYTATPALQLESVHITRYDDFAETWRPVSDHLPVTAVFRTAAVGA